MINYQCSISNVKKQRADDSSQLSEVRKKLKNRLNKMLICFILVYNIYIERIL